MSELTVFLEARLAEDADPSWTLVPYRCRPGCCAPAGWVGRRCHICDDGEIFGGTVEAITEVAEEHAESIHQRSRVLAEVEAKRAIVAWHKNWPVLVETPPEFEQVDSTDPQSFAFRASQKIAWMTEREYVARFGSDPPTSPILRMLASVYRDHPDYQEGWAL